MYKMDPKTIEQKEFDCAYYCNADPCVPFSSDVPNNVPAFFGDLFNVITAPFNIKIAIDNHKRRIARRERKERWITEFLNEKAYQSQLPKKDQLSEIRKWLAKKCKDEKIALSIRDIYAWEERLQFIQHQAILRDAFKNKDKESYDCLEKALKPNDKISAITTQTVFGVIKHVVFGVAGVIGICGITFGLVTLAIACPITIPLAGAIGFQAISVINNFLWCSANGVEYDSKRRYAKKKVEKLQKYKKFFDELSDEIKDKNIKRILDKKLRNAKLRYKMEKYRSWSLAALITGAVGMFVSGIMLATGIFLSVTGIGASVGIPLIIAGGIIGAAGAAAFMGGYAGNVLTRRKENKEKEKNRLADKSNSEIAKIIEDDSILEENKKELRDIQKEGIKRTLGFTLTGLIVALPVIPLSVLSVFFPPLAPLATALTIVATGLLAAGVISGTYTAIKSNKIQRKIAQRECELINEAKFRSIPGYEKMPMFKPQPKLTFWKRIRNLFSRKKKQQPGQIKIEEEINSSVNSTPGILAKLPNKPVDPEVWCENNNTQGKVTVAPNESTIFQPCGAQSLNPNPNLLDPLAQRMVKA